MKDVQMLSEDRVILSTGTLYGALKRLLADGWIERAEENQANESGRQRKVYALTDRGRQIMDAEVARMQTLVRTAQFYTTGERV
jgi:DNA-binding PadR family transcriptional regulator